MLLAAFLAGSFVPFSSETVMAALWAVGLNPVLLVVYGTIGNTLGSIFNYIIGSFGHLRWLEKWRHIKPATLRKAENFVRGRGALMGFFCFLPVLGSALSVALGMAKSNMLLTFLSMAVGKLLRYVILIFGLVHIIHTIA